MPTCRRKRVVLMQPSDAVMQGAKTNPDHEVYFLQQTGEIFESYEAYASRMSFYKLKQFQCEVTGKSGLDYFQAVDSEQLEARTMHSRFPEPLKPAVLKAVQWQVMGRLDHLVEAVYNRFKDRYFIDEKLYVETRGDKLYAKVVKVFPPTSATNRSTSTSSPLLPSVKEEALTVHATGGDLRIPFKEALVKDDPLKYLYQVQILEDRYEKCYEKGKVQARAQVNPSGNLVDVQCTSMSRDRLAFSKSILRRFIRDCVDRDPAVASPWVVKLEIAKRYGLASTMTEETRRGVQDIKKGEIDKRKKFWEGKEGSPVKKQRKSIGGPGERAKTIAAVAEQREREALEKIEKQQKVKEDTERLAAEKKKKKPMRYPTEDLDIWLSDKEKKTGAKLVKPVPSRVALPFGDDQNNFGAFLMVWNFLVVFGQPLHLSTFTMDEFEHAMEHTAADAPCQLLAEIHSTLIYNLRSVSFTRHSAVLSLLHTEEHSGAQEPVLGVSLKQLIAAMADVGNNWERVPLRHADLRVGWEDALVGCLKDHATLETFPRLRGVLTHLFFGQEQAHEQRSSSVSCRPSPSTVTIQLSPGQLYYALPATDRIAILAFLCNMAISSKAIHAHMDSCEEQLTALRKEKIEVNRMKKQYVEEMSTLVHQTEVKDDSATTPGGDYSFQDSSDLSDIPSDNDFETTPGAGRPMAVFRDKAHYRQDRIQAMAKQRELARAKVASTKQSLAEHRRLDEEVNKLERRLEGIERDFRKLLGAIRVKPLGRDRFYNRIWWFDGVGSASLLGSGGVVQYGTGRIFVQGPSISDAEMLDKRRVSGLDARRTEEEGEKGILGVGEWAVYVNIEELDDFVAWLNPKGIRELALKNSLMKWWNHIVPGMRKRIADLSMSAKAPEARRSRRTKPTAGHDFSREPYMMWMNRKAMNIS
ncbi:hypothetical protein SERLA73DRAFT_82321 [Serpula lacrymans var. lacrymans S7.3]|uniref:WAC domain-containing protein n=2 Tax=Serpula lacrymans var. lacrymans TaxID=341189 RepID=F8PFQ6_SERL3|nr:uncharacterized protein SERLADRAFT_444288 [Serpula lacrymans var. lacrymans S7.9]EGO04257.1 hypothetical protein SERLA73DRAFT_82321 [Serpula lacrymans var. lacrymans S7.3]EGO30189.1 hypothetical protein SERLADRAFT_444288 [Serpula lacrymans var. lacrymans S7.9]